MEVSSAERPSPSPGALRFAGHLVVAALAIGAAGCATTGSIRGTLAITPTTERADSAMVTHDASGAELSSVTNAVVFVQRDRESKPRHGRWWKRAHMGQTPAGFEPRVIVVTAGTTVEFENRDSIYHGAFSVATAKRFNTGLVAPSQRRRVLFDRPGVVNVFCELHPEAAGFVVVRPDGLFARPDASGGFRLPQLPDGTYTIEAWHPIYGETIQRVSVPRKAHTIVRLTL